MNKHHNANCDQCPLASTGTYTHPREFGQSDIAVVTGVPFPSEAWSGGFENSNAGELLNKVFIHHGLSSQRSYHHAVLCRPQEGQKVNNAAIAACRPRLISEINSTLRASGKVLALGAEASAALLPGSGGVLTARVGPPKVSPYLSTFTSVVASVSPYLCMSQHQNFPNLVTDVEKLFNPIVTFSEPSYDIYYSVEDTIDYLKNCLYVAKQLAHTLVIDIECIIDKESSFGHPENFEMLCIGIKFGTNPIKVLTADVLTKEVYKLLEELCKQTKIVAHNGKFDLNGLRPHIGRQSIGADTMLASYVFDERTGAGNYHGLKYLAQEYLGAPPYDDEIEQYTGKTNKDFSKVPKNLLYKYNAFDVHCTYLLNSMYVEKFKKDKELAKLYQFLLKASDLLMDLEYSGICVDESYLVELSDKLQHNIDYKQYKLALGAFKVRKEGYDPKLGGINPNSPMQLKAFYNDCGIELDSTDVETLNKILDYKGELGDNDALVRRFTKRVLEFRSDKKLKSTYVDGIRERAYKGRVHSSYLLHGTTTGRLSSRNPNLQNIPRNSPIKQLFIASKSDNVICNVDYSQAELRVLTFLAKDSYFQEIFNDPDRDVFDELVPELFPGSNKELDDPKEFKEKRTMVKTYVYGLSYGRTEYGIARGFNIPVELAKQHKKRFFAVIPNIIKWQNEIKRSVLNGNDLVTPFGRRRRYSLITEENERDILNESLAFIPQSTASDMCLQAAISVNDWFNNPDINWVNGQPKIVNLVHDAIMFECYKGDADLLGKSVSQAMIDSAQTIVGDYVRFDTDYSYAYSWGGIK